MPRSIWGGGMFCMCICPLIIFGSLTILLPSCLFALCFPRVGRNVIDAFMTMFWAFVLVCVENVLHVQIVIQGQFPPAGSNVLMISNHPSRLDWMYLMCVQTRYSSLCHHRIVLKHALKKVPFLGWGMQAYTYIFLHRIWNEDERIMNSVLDYGEKVNHQTQIIFFPEGTDLSKSSQQKSRLFAEKNGFPNFDSVLCPRTKGFSHLVTAMKAKRILDWVSDVTIVYLEGAVYNEFQLLKGYTPREIHIRVKNYPVEGLPSSQQQLGSWCLEKWQEKERMLKHFHVFKRFPADSVDKETSVSRNGLSGTSSLMPTVATVIALALHLFHFYAIYFCPWFRLYCLVACMVWLIVECMFDGMDKLLCKLAF